MKILKFLVLAVSALTLVSAITAREAVAQPRLMEGLDEKGEPFSNKYYREMPSEVAVSLLSRGDLPDGQFIVRLSTTDARTGCPRLSPLTYELGYDNMYLDIQLGDFDFLVERLLAVEHHQRGHELGDGRDGRDVRGITLEQHLAVLAIDDERGGGTQVRFARLGRQTAAVGDARKGNEGEQRDESEFHVARY